MAKTKEELLSIEEAIKTLRRQLGELSNEELEEVLKETKLNEIDLKFVAGGENSSYVPLREGEGILL